MAYKTLESILTNHSQAHSLSFFSRICKLECNTTSDWLNRMVRQSEVVFVLHSHAAKYKKNSGERDKEHSKEPLVNTDPEFYTNRKHTHYFCVELDEVDRKIFHR